MTPEEFLGPNPTSCQDFQSLWPPLPWEFPACHPSGGGGVAFFWNNPMSNFAKRVPGTNFEAILIMSSILMYWRCQESGLIPSLTLWPWGEDKSTMRCHLPGWPFLGVTPELLMWRFCTGGESKGPTTRPSLTLLAENASITPECWYADNLFLFADFKVTGFLQPGLNPSLIPSRTKLTFALSGWCLNLASNNSKFRGEISPVAGKIKHEPRMKTVLTIIILVQLLSVLLN